MDNILDDDEFRIILERLNRPWSGYRKVRKGVKKRIRRHMRQLGTSDIFQYLQLLEQDEREMMACKEFLQVTISRFFRDRHLWVYLNKEILPELSRKFPSGVRIWAAGCGCGEEVYSLAILWHQLKSGVLLNILATDINRQNLARAEKGCYRQSSMKEVINPIRINVFHKQPGKDVYCIDDGYKSSIVWQHHDFFSPLNSEPFHMVFLRNSLLTYHRGEQRDRGLRRLLNLVKPGGYLVTGSHETVPEKFTNLSRLPACPYLYKKL